MRSLKNDKGYIQYVGAVVGVLLVIAVGLMTFWMLSDSIKTGSASGAVVHAQVNTTAGTVFGLAPVIPIVLIASIILGVILSFGMVGGAKP